jgi:hypothetical protein
MSEPIIHSRSLYSQPIWVANGSATLIARALSFRPFRNAAIVWNRPTAVKVQYGDGSEQLIPVRDVTRLALLLILASGLLSMIAIWQRDRRYEFANKR